MRTERGESSFLVLDDNLYAFFGYNCPRSEYVTSIERLNMSCPKQWDLIKFNNSGNVTTKIKAHSCLLINCDKILIIGGFNGEDESPLEEFINFNMSDLTMSRVPRKYPEIVHNHFYDFKNENSLSSYMDIKGRNYLIGFDDHDRVHSIETQMLNYDLFKFD